MTNLLKTKPIVQDGQVSPFIQRLYRLVVRLMGWRVDQWELAENVRKVVVVGAHHTSNWDGFLMVFICNAMGRKLRWLVKSELDLPVLSYFLRLSGGIFVDRHESKGVVGQAIDIINESEHIFLALAPEGTRSKKDRWKTGFYYMALGADVPIGLGYLDYKEKRAGIAQLIIPTGNIKVDEVIFQEFYANINAKHPENVSTVRLEPQKNLPEETPETV